MTASGWDDFTDCYEALIDWPKRLAHETPFYRRLFAAVGARSVLDVACGTGRHAAMFHDWGMQVAGADVNSAMLDHARQNFGHPPGLRWIHRGYTESVESADRHDVVICVGNSLALAPDVPAAQTAVGHMFAATRAGGAVVVHVLNLWRLPDGPCVWQKAIHTILQQGPSVIVKGVHRSESTGYVELVVAHLADPLTFRSSSVPFLGLDATQLKQWAREAGAAKVDLFGGYQGERYQSDSSPDLIMVATMPPSDRSS